MTAGVSLSTFVYYIHIYIHVYNICTRIYNHPLPIAYCILRIAYCVSVIRSDGVGSQVIVVPRTVRSLPSSASPVRPRPSDFLSLFRDFALAFQWRIHTEHAQGYLGGSTFLPILGCRSRCYEFRKHRRRNKIVDFYHVES